MSRQEQDDRQGSVISSYFLFSTDLVCVVPLHPKPSASEERGMEREGEERENIEAITAFSTLQSIIDIRQ